MIDHFITYDRSDTVEEESSTTLGVWDEGVWIDIGNHNIINLRQIEAIHPYSRDDDSQYFYNSPPPDGVILSVVRTTGGAGYASTLTWRELRNRLRKAKHVII